MTLPTHDRPIVIAGAGAVGGFVGGALAATGRRVRLLARPSVIEEVRTHGLQLTDLDGGEARLSVADFDLMTDNGVAAFSGAGTVMVTVKSAATTDMASLIAAHAPQDAVIVSLQNGVANVARLRAGAPAHDVRAGVFAPNVARIGPGQWRRGTDGGVHVEAGEPDVAALFAGSLLSAQAHADMTSVQWGKILMNLNNAVNALSGLPLRAQLADPRWRKLLARSIREATALLNAAGQPIAAVGKARPAQFRRLLSLPTPLFLFALDRLVRVDATATSSMQDDLNARRATEIDDLQGEVLALAQRLGRDAPLARAVRDAVRAAEAAGAGPPHLSHAQFDAQLGPLLS